MNEHQLDQLRDTLRRETQHIHPVGLGSDTVRRRGRRRRNRGRTVVAVGAATCVAGLGVSLAERGGGAPHSLAVAAQSAPTVTPTLEFRVVDGTVSNSTMHFTTAAGVTYELSTAPGVAANPAAPGQAIYSTTDGEHWTTAAQTQPWISDLSENDGVLYAIGTAPGASADAVQYRVATSHDGGEAWSQSDLPFDLSTPTATVPVSRSSYVEIASGPAGTVALLTEQFQPDLTALVAARTAGHANVMPRQTSSGYDLVDMTACTAAAPSVVGGSASALSAAKTRFASRCEDAPVLGTITWSDIGLTGPGDLSRQELLITTDGSHWNSVTEPMTGFPMNLDADSNGFLLAETNNPPVGSPPANPGESLLRSADGRTWTTVSTPAGLNVQEMAGDLIVGVDASGIVQTSADGGTTWNATNVSSLLPAGAAASSVVASDAGPLGFALLATADQPNGPDYLLFSSDGVDWTTTDLATVGEPATGYPMGVTVGADHISVDYGAANPTAGAAMKITTLLATPKR